MHIYYILYTHHGVNVLGEGDEVGRGGHQVQEEALFMWWWCGGVMVVVVVIFNMRRVCTRMRLGMLSSHAHINHRART